MRQRHEASHDDTPRREAFPLVLRLVGHAGKVAAASGGFPVDASSGGISSPVPWIPDEVGIVSAVTAKPAEAGEVIAPSSRPSGLVTRQTARMARRLDWTARNGGIIRLNDGFWRQR
ncbi:MAG: hypothetical protein ABTS22_09295 [Accumulibacter sp.]|uniref:hypothetical protein n=1 Tax=Accumulibacter sp. TaxID=2053492 RepID=UPI0033146A73